MKKLIFVLGLLLLVSPVFAGTLNVGGRAGLYTANQPGATLSVIYGVGAEYLINDNFSVRGTYDTTTYSVFGVQTTYTPITLDLIYGYNVLGVLRPYVGVGGSYNTISAGGISTSTSGAQVEAGLRFALWGFSSGIEYKYSFPDLNHLENSTSTVNGNMSGSFMQSFNI